MKNKRIKRNKELSYMDIKNMGLDMDMEQYALGGWLKENAGTIGMVGGMAIGGALGSVVPGVGTAIGASLGSSLGGSIGGAVQNNEMQNQALATQNEQTAAMAQQSKLNMANQRVQNTPLANNGVIAKCGGKLPRYKRGGSVSELTTMPGMSFNEYGGQLHSGANQGINIDAQGNTLPSRKGAVGLAEGKEASYTVDGQTYVFPEANMFDKKKSIADKAKDTMKLSKFYGGHDTIANNYAKKKLGELQGFNDEVNIANGKGQEMSQNELPMARRGGFADNLNNNIRASAQNSLLNYQQPMGFDTTQDVYTQNGRFFPNDTQMLWNAPESNPDMGKNTMGQFSSNTSGAPGYAGYATQSEYIQPQVGQTPQITPEQLAYNNSLNEIPIDEPVPFQSSGNIHYGKNSLFANTNAKADTVLNDLYQDKVLGKTNTPTPESTDNLYRGMGWGDAALSALPGIASGIINSVAANNLKAPDKLRLSRMTPQQISLERERQAAREQANLTRSNTSRGLRGNVGSIGQYMANMGNTQAGIGRGLSQQLGQSYMNEELQNAQFRQQADMANMDANTREQMYNNQLQNQFEGARRNMRTQALGQGLGAISGAIGQKMMANQFYDQVNMMNPNFDLEMDGNKWFQAGRTPRKRVRNNSINNTGIGQG
jgi:hypothetical protein